MPRTLRTWLLCGSVVLSAACGDSRTADSDAPTTDRSEYCDAMAAMAAAQPPGGVVEPEQLADALRDYASAVDAAAEVSEPADSETLRELADTMRAAADDPTADGLADRVGALFTPMLGITNKASAECDISFDAE